MELYLITGFLGAGKTTFLKNFARQFAGRRLRLIINEFGRAGVDGTAACGSWTRRWMRSATARFSAPAVWTI